MGAMKQLVIEVEELTDFLLLDLDLDPDKDENQVYRGRVEDRLLEWVERTFLSTETGS